MGKHPQYPVDYKTLGRLHIYLKIIKDNIMSYFVNWLIQSAAEGVERNVREPGGDPKRVM